MWSSLCPALIFLTPTSLQEAVGFGYSFTEVRSRSGFFFSFVFRKQFTNCFEHGGAGGV